MARALSPSRHSGEQSPNQSGRPPGRCIAGGLPVSLRKAVDRCLESPNQIVLVVILVLLIEKRFILGEPTPWTARVSQAAAGASPADSTAHRQLLAGRGSARFSEAVGCGGLPQASGTRGGHGILRIQNAECGMVQTANAECGMRNLKISNWRFQIGNCILNSAFPIWVVPHSAFRTLHLIKGVIGDGRE